MNQEIINLYDEYTHKPLARQEFLTRLAKLAGGTAAAMSLLPLLEVNYAHAATIAADDLHTERASYMGDGQTMSGYLARPIPTGKYAAVVVIHENRGLNPHTEDVARRLASKGYLAFAPDALSPLGGAPADNADAARELFGKLDAQQTTRNFLKAFEYLAGRPDVNGKMACIGFCWGGAMANSMAVMVPTLKAAIPFYGRQPKPEEVPAIKAAVQLHYAGLDERVNAGIPAYEAALKANNKQYELYMYEGANHAFFNDTAPTRYSKEAADLAWQRVLAFLAKHLA